MYINCVLNVLSKFGWISATQIKFNPAGSLLFVIGSCKVIRMNDVELGEMVVYQVSDDNDGHDDKAICRFGAEMSGRSGAE